MVTGSRGMAAFAPEERFVDWRLIAKGGTASVYRVRDTTLRCDVAIKLLNPKAVDSESALALLRESLFEEVRISRSLPHPYICRVHDPYDGADGQVGVVMSYISGMTLRAWMDARKGRLADTIEERLGLLRKLAEALIVAHRGIVHRDLKPENIMLDNGDIASPVILDFGCSAFAEQAVGLAGMTAKYMAPEQYQSWRDGVDDVDARADLFAFGVIAYELLTDRVPEVSLEHVFEANAPARMTPEEIPPPSQICKRVPVALDKTIKLLLQDDRDQRIQTADQLLEALNVVQPIPVDALVSDIEVEKILVPAGRFRLGSRPDPKTKKDEWPGIMVRMLAFRIDATPVTNFAFREFLDDVGGVRPGLIDHPVYGHDVHPVVGVTHARAQEFARWAGGFLPSEAQWEYAAKVDGGHAYPWGAEFDGPHRANINRLANEATTSPVYAHPLGRTPSGLWDMCGNVWEWCADIYGATFYGTLDREALDPRNDGESGDRVLRGGAYQSVKSQGRSAFRYFAPPDTERAEIGFRVAYGVSSDE